ncbi:hypothetical protein, partial [Hyphomicrobium sp.]|uniref:hypothetical protein n=1 Tax=Hyphomicrobium sp. TaxID=82 RepID=UPI002D1F9AB7
MGFKRGPYISFLQVGSWGIAAKAFRQDLRVCLQVCVCALARRAINSYGAAPGINMRGEVTTLDGRRAAGEVAEWSIAPHSKCGVR